MQVRDTADGKARKKTWSAPGWPRKKKKILEEEALDRPLWRTRCRRGYGPVGRQIVWWRPKPTDHV